MTRTQLQLDDDTYQALRRRAFAEHRSISAVAREALKKGLGLEAPPHSLKDMRLTFVGSGVSGRTDISVRHDEALAEDFRR